jgi:hypothetical protein
MSLTIDDTDPVIDYQGAWGGELPKTLCYVASALTGAVRWDTESDRNVYWNWTRHYTDTNATAAIAWVGTGITLYGGSLYRCVSPCMELAGNLTLISSSYGYYSISLDKGEKIYKKGSSVPNAFQQVKYAVDGLQHGAHVLVLQNEPFYRPDDATTPQTDGKCECHRCAFGTIIIV